jgi:hypothetical protein
LGQIPPPIPSFQWYPQSKEIFINSQHFNAQGSRVILIIVQVRAVAVVEALRRKEGQDETQFTSRIAGKNYPGSQLFRFVKIFIPSYRLDALLP